MVTMVTAPEGMLCPCQHSVCHLLSHSRAYRHTKKIPFIPEVSWGSSLFIQTSIPYVPGTPLVLCPNQNTTSNATVMDGDCHKTQQKKMERLNRGGLQQLSLVINTRSPSARISCHHM